MHFSETTVFTCKRFLKNGIGNFKHDQGSLDQINMDAKLYGKQIIFQKTMSLR